MNKKLKIDLLKKGSSSYTKASYPVRYGIYNQVEYKDYIYQFNINGEIKYIRHRGKERAGDEWLKRTAGNDWIYYTPGIYKGIESYIGEFYLPCFNYPSNSIFAYRPFDDVHTLDAVKSLDTLIEYIPGEICSGNIETDDFKKMVLSNNLENLKKRSEDFHEITGGKISVLPPDARHVDYDVIPLNIISGCLYNCRFCMVRSGEKVTVKSMDDIKKQVEGLKNFYGKDLLNYNSIFIGNHDGLHAGKDSIISSAELAYKELNFNHSYMKGSNLFIFGSINSFLESEPGLYEELNRLPYYTYINIGLESADNDTLKILGKPVDSKQVAEAFRKMQEINRIFPGIEITVNFLLSDKLPLNHTESIINLCKSPGTGRSGKGAVYLSPFDIDRSSVELQQLFKKIKTSIDFPAFIYLIQRL